MRFVVEGQSLYIRDITTVIAEGSVEFVVLSFTFSDDWHGYEKVVQFKQGDLLLNAVIDSEGKVYLPHEIHRGAVYLSVFGYKAGYADRATSEPIALDIKESLLCEEGSTPIPPTPDLYSQLLAEIRDTSTKLDQFSGVRAQAETLLYNEPAYARVEVENGFMTLYIGVPGSNPGDRITNISVDEENKIIITLADGTVYTAGEFQENIIRVQDLQDLPSVGRFNAIYVVSNTRKAYTFNEEPFGYVAIGDVDTMTILSGGDANG